MDGILPTDIFSLDVGKRWVYTVGSGIFRRDVNVEVVDKKKNNYLIKFSMGSYSGAAVIKTDVDMSIIAVAKYGTDTLDDESLFQAIPKVELLKSPLITGLKWQNSLGEFSIVSTNHYLKLEKKTYPDCIHLRIRDTSDAYNDIFIKSGIGIVFASVYIDGIGKVNLNLKQFS